MFDLGVHNNLGFHQFVLNSYSNFLILCQESIQIMQCLDIIPKCSLIVVRSAYLYIQSPCNVLCSTTKSLQCLEFHYRILTCPIFHYEVLAMSYVPLQSPCNVQSSIIESLHVLFSTIKSLQCPLLHYGFLTCHTFKYIVLVMSIELLQILCVVLLSNTQSL